MKSQKEIKQRYQENKEVICAALEWTELEYTTFQLERMYEYMVHNAGTVEVINYYGESPAYCRWWVNQWNLRDLRNIHDIHLPTLRERRMFYEYRHSIEYLTHTYFKRRVMEESEAAAIGRVFDQQRAFIKQLRHE